MSSVRDISDIPSKYHSIFSPIRQFNHVQSEVFHDVFRTHKHIVVSAPTGSGKTAIFEMAIVKLLMHLEHTNFNIKDAKIVYVAPTKALCNEIFQKWQEKFNAIDLKVALVTGDSDPTEMSNLNDLSSYQIAVTTPEKWDAMTRKWLDHWEIANAVRLALIDEVHLVGDTLRGPTLEAIVTRIKTFPANQNNGHIRFIAVSASLPNIEDIARWIGAEQTIDSVRTFKFEESTRTVKLNRYVYDYTPPLNSYLFNNLLTTELIKILNKILLEPTSRGKQILIFCPTRNDVESSLDRLLKDHELLNKVQVNGIQRSILNDVYRRIQDEKLRSTVQTGVAFHHAGLSYEDREHIENVYRKGAIKILLSTNTLAMGVNLPAHTVIIKSTEHFVNGSTQEIPESMIIQMMGRAGRQQYNTTGQVYIMTTTDKKEFYENLAVGTVQIESHLKTKLAEFLNAEIALNTVTDSDASVMQWLRTTFLYARTIAQSPMTENEIQIELNDLCKRAIYDLRHSRVVEQRPDGSLSSLPFGAVMAKYFLSIPTIKAFQGLRGEESIFEILDKIVNCNEFMDIYLRRNEKKILNDVNQRIRFPILSTIQTIPQKISCLLQAFLGHVHIENSALLMDLRRIVQTTERLVNSLIDFCQTEQFTQKCFKLILSATILLKSLRTNTWTDRDVLNGLNISKADVNKLTQTGINTVDALMKINPREIEDILNKEIPFGSELIEEMATKFPSYAVNADVMGGHVINVRVIQTNFQYACQPTSTGNRLTLLIGDSFNNLICYEDIQPILSEIGYYEKLLTLEDKVTAGCVHVIHHSLVGVDKMVEFSFERPTQMVDMETPKKNPSVLSKKITTKKKFIPKTPSDRSSTSVGKQSTLSQYFGSKKKASNQNIVAPKKISVFDVPKRVEATKKLLYSPDLFPTQSDATQKPERIYDFDYVQSSINYLPPNHVNEVYIDQSEVRQTPCLAKTPIQKKIHQQQSKQNELMNGFVCANAIFNNESINENPVDTQKPSHQKNHSLVNDIESLFECNEIENDVLQIMEKFDNPNSSHFQNKRNGLASTSLHSHKNGTDQAIQEILNLNVRIVPQDTIKHDFDDSDEKSNQVEIPQFPQRNKSTNLPSEFWIDFFSTDSTGDDLDEDANYDQPPAKRIASDNVYENSTVVSPPSTEVAPSSVQRALCPSRHLPGSSSAVMNASQASVSSNKAVCGSPKQNLSLSRSTNPESSITKMAVSEFEYRTPSKMSPNTLRQNNMKRSAHCTETGPIEQKKLTLIDTLLKNGERSSNEFKRKIINLRNGNSKQQPAVKSSLRHTFARIPLNDNKADINTDNLIKQCEERLKTDKNYTQRDFDLDFVRLKILKIAPTSSPTV